MIDNICLANLDLILQQPTRRPEYYLVLDPGEYERWQSRGDGTHDCYGVPPSRVMLSLPIGYWRSEYAARCWWLASEWHR